MHSKLIDAWHSGWEISDQCPGNKFYTNKFCHAPHSRSIWKRIVHIQRKLVFLRNKIKSQSRVILLLRMKNLHFCFVLIYRFKTLRLNHWTSLRNYLLFHQQTPSTVAAMHLHLLDGHLYLLAMTHDSYAVGQSYCRVSYVLR